MKYIKGLSQYSNENQTAITIGKFDGLHLGHELLISKIIEYSKTDCVDSIVLAFETNGAVTNHKIISNDERRKRLENRVDYLIECPLDKELSSMEAENFVRDILVKLLHVKYIVVGENFRFGYQKKGCSNLLQTLGKDYGFHVDVIPQLCYREKEISSTYIREQLEKGNMELAQDLLGYKFSNNKKIL